MMAEQVEGFIEGLIDKTTQGLLNWKNLTVFPSWDQIDQELRREDFPVDFENMNTVRMQNSYFLQSGNGYVFLFEIFHGNPEVTSPEMDSVALVVKINDALAVDCLSNFNEEEQARLRTLQLSIENYLEEKYTYPDVLYKFFDQVLSE